MTMMKFLYNSTTGSLREDAVTALRLELPLHSEDSAAASQKWLLSLWEASRKSTWSLWRNRATISLEYVAEPGDVRYEVHFSHPLLAGVSRAVLPAYFPGIEVSPAEPESTDRVLESSLGCLLTFKLRSAGWVDLPKDVDPEGVSALVATLESLGKLRAILVQLLLEPTWMTTEDGRQPAFWLMGRIAAVGSSESDAWQKARLVGAALGQFAGFNGFRLSHVRRLTAADRRSIAERRWPRRVLPGGPPATAAQTAMLYHPPTDAASFAHLRQVSYRRTPAPATNAGVSLGEGRDSTGSPTDVRVLPADLLRHALVIGPSGTGKTTLLAHLARELAQQGHGVSVIDPHGTLVQALARTLPAHREGDADLLRFSNTDYPICLNPFNVRPGHEAVAADELVEIVQRVYGREYWGPLLDLVLRHAAMATMELGGSLIESARLLDDPWFREQALVRLQNAETVRFLSQLSDGGSYDRRILPAVHRLQRLLATPWLRNIVGQRGPGLDFADLFDRRRLALFDLSGIGTTNARLLGSLILLMIRQATLSRFSPGKAIGPRHFVLVDEASWFISRTVGELFDQARKFGIGVILAVQRHGQLAPEDVRDAVLANAGTLLTFRISDQEEARFLKRRTASERIEASDLQHLPRYEAYVQLTHEGDRLEPAWLRTPQPPPEPTNGQATEMRILEAARRRYARPRAEVERELRDREQAFVEDGEPEVRGIPLPAVAVPANAP